MNLILFLLASGIITGVYLDCWQLIRSRASKFGASLGDMAVWLLFVFGYFGLLYKYYQGQFSFSCLVLTLLGALLYYLGLRKFCLGFLDKIITFLLGLLSRIFCVILWPFAWVSKIMGWPFRCLKKLLNKLS